MKRFLILLVTLVGVKHGKILNNDQSIYLFQPVLKVKYFAVLCFFLYAFFPGAAITCTVSQNTSLCSATLEGSVYIQMMTIASGHQVWFHKKFPEGMIKIFTFRNKSCMIQESYKNRTEFFISNTTLKLMHLERNDSGLYRADFYDNDGRLFKSMELMLDIQGKYLEYTVKIHVLFALY